MDRNCRSATASAAILGDQVAVDLYGPGGAPGALFVQGAGLERSEDPLPTETARIIAELGYQASVHDRVGRGDSFASGPISIDREIAAITAIADRLVGPVILVGHSSGCALAILAANEIPNLAGLVLFEAPLGQFPGGAPRWWQAVRTHIDRGELRDAVESYMVDMPEEWLEELQRSPAYPQIGHSWIPDGTALAAVEAEGPEAYLGKLAVPVLAVTGTETFPGMVNAAAMISDAAPEGSAEQVRGAWHSWDAATMAQRLVRLLAETTQLRPRRAPA
ncbi:alpha/beta hydrolase [Microbacterium terregens]|uniref:Alpha/beta fold hydrolase n=1 Tax=Microbacterium terregens TaxID=69363 RepID=A0ABV5T5K3_9MICO